MSRTIAYLNSLNKCVFRGPGRRFHSAPRAGSTLKDSDVVILSSARTPIASFQSHFASLTAPQLASIAAKEAIKRSSLSPSDFHEFLFGNVCSANLGQAPSTQAALLSGLPTSTPTTTINKVCSSSLKALTIGAASITTGTNEVVLVTGAESMTNVPYYLPKAREGMGFGHGEVVDGLIKDGLFDPVDHQLMGVCADLCAKQYKISREVQDEYALNSYAKAVEATKQGLFKREIVPVTVTIKGKSTVHEEDEEPNRLQKAKVPTLKPAFTKDSGTVTAANASKLNDGAAAITISSYAYAKARGLTPLARILSYGDAQKPPVEFTTAPSLVIPLVLRRAGLSLQDVDYYEINEAFSAVALANVQILGLPIDRVNAFGGAVALGHPLGASGARIVVTLLNVLKHHNKNIGVAAICNGGGGASGIALERLN